MLKVANFLVLFTKRIPPKSREFTLSPLLLPWVTESLRPVAPAGHGFRIAPSCEIPAVGCHGFLNRASVLVGLCARSVKLPGRLYSY